MRTSQTSGAMWLGRPASTTGVAAHIDTIDFRIRQKSQIVNLTGTAYCIQISSMPHSRQRLSHPVGHEQATGGAATCARGVAKMLVQVQPGTGAAAHSPSGADAKVHDLSAGWAYGAPHMIGSLALLNVNIPDKTRTRQVDGLLFLPAGLAVLEVKGFTAPQSG